MKLDLNMKFYFIFFMFIAYICTVHTSDNNNNNPLLNGIPLPNGMPSINIVVNTANQAHANQTSNVTQDTQHSSTHRTDIKQERQPNIDFDKLYALYKQQCQNAQQASSTMMTWIKNNKIKTLGMNLLCFYSYISYQIYQANLIINDSNSWSNWHNGQTLDDLLATSQANLEADLLFTIQTRYVHPVNPTDFIYSIAQSSTSLNKEIQILQEQISRYQWLESFRCMSIFLIDSKSLELLKEKRRKLSFIKHLFTSWCANYKIDKNS